MNSYKVEKFIYDELKREKIYTPRKIYKDLEVNVYNMSFGAITISIRGAFGCVSGYVSNYDAIKTKIHDFIYNSSFNLYSAYYWKHHKRGATK